MTVCIPKIEATRNWTPERVRAACIRNYLYTKGTTDEYMHMLNLVGIAAEGPTQKNLYIVAKDIADHSDCQTICNVMYILENEAVFTTFEINGRDDI